MPGEHRKRELVGSKFIVTHLIDNSHEGWRADQFLKTQYKHFSRNRLQALIDDGRIQIERAISSGPQKLKASTTLHSGDRISVATEKTEEPEVDIKYRVLYEDEYCLAIDKPGNLPVHPAGRFLFNTLLMHLRRERASEVARTGKDFHLIHRLDRETSGVMVLAKGSEMAAHLVKQFRERNTEKKYWAICEGHPKEDAFIVDADIGPAKDSHVRLKMQGFPKGTSQWHAETHFKVLKRGTKTSLVDCDLKTGRQHQIRVHLSYAGHPVVGDKLYGSDDRIFLDFIHTRQLKSEIRELLGSERQALHSRYLKFYHDILGKWIELESPLPPDLKLLLE